MAATQKLDLYKKYKAEYVTPKAPTLVRVKRATYLGVSGKGEPGSDMFMAQMGALFAVAYTVKMTKKAAGRGYKVCAPEGLWWGKRKGGDFSQEPQSQWNWKLLIRTPDFITKKDVDEAAAKLKEKGKGPEVAKVKLEIIEEGLCVQMLHVGPYSAEVESIALMKQFAKEQGLSFHSPHHEIYLSDPRRVAPERLRTILRQPVQ